MNWISNVGILVTFLHNTYSQYLPENNKNDHQIRYYYEDYQTGNINAKQNKYINNRDYDASVELDYGQKKMKCKCVCTRNCYKRPDPVQKQKQSCCLPECCYSGSRYPPQDRYPAHGRFPGQDGYPYQDGYQEQNGYPDQDGYPSQNGYYQQDGRPWDERYQYPNTGQKGYPGENDYLNQQRYPMYPDGDPRFPKYPRYPGYDTSRKVTPLTNFPSMFPFTLPKHFSIYFPWMSTAKTTVSSSKTTTEVENPSEEEITHSDKEETDSHNDKEDKDSHNDKEETDSHNDKTDSDKKETEASKTEPTTVTEKVSPTETTKNEEKKEETTKTETTTALTNATTVEIVSKSTLPYEIEDEVAVRKGGRIGINNLVDDYDHNHKKVGKYYFNDLLPRPTIDTYLRKKSSIDSFYRRRNVDPTLVVPIPDKLALKFMAELRTRKY